MKFCPKCRSFYDDEDLAFCQTDGIPLINLDKSSELWREGTEAVQATNEIAQKQIRIRKLKKIAKVSVTIVITMLVISELVRNTDISSLTETDEKANNNSPAPIVKSNVSPKKNKTIANNSVNSNINNPKCSDNEKKDIISSVRNNNFEKWENELKNQEDSVKKEFSGSNSVPTKEIKLSLNFTKDNIQVASPDCQSATATVNFTWTVKAILSYKIEKKDIPGDSLTFECQKKSGWKCE